METKSTFMLAEIKAATSENPNGEFEIVMSTDSVDRDGEIIVKGAFDPLPESIPVHAFHDFSDPIGRATPGYNENGQLVGRGFFASTPRAQEMRQLVADGVIGHTSVGFMGTERAMKDGVPHITSAELLEVSFVSVPSNRDAAVLMAKKYDGKAGARNSTKDGERLQSIHDLAVENGADCSTAKGFKSIAGSYEQRRDQLRDAVRNANPDAWWTSIVATFDDTLVYEVEGRDGSVRYQATYSIADDGAVTLGAGEPVEVAEVVIPKNASTDEVEEKSTDEVDSDTTGAAETDDGDDLALRARALSLAAFVP